MTEPLRSSSEVLEFVEDLDRSFIEQYPDEGPEMLERGCFIAERVRISREEFSDDIIPALNDLSTRHPDLFEGDLNRLYVREVVAAVPGYVSRTLQLSGLAAGRKPNEAVSKYLAEAVRAYIVGFPLASIAISRAILEQAVRECMTGQPEGASLAAWFEQLAEERGLDNVMTDMAKSVIKAGNNVIHQKPMKLSEAFGVLVKVRKILESLYSPNAPE
jgi:hypothetical protein